MAYTASQIKSVLQEANKTQEGYNVWRQMYGAVDLAKQQQLNTLKYDTEKEIGETFAEAFKARQAIDNSNYFDAAKEEFNNEIYDTFNQAYANYMNNYAKGVNQIETAAAEGRQAITDKLNEESENYSKVYDSLYYYLENLYKDTFYSPETPSAFWTDESRSWSKYLVDEDGAKRLVTREELANGIKDPDTGEYLLNPLYTLTADNKQELTTSGEDFIDQMLNDMAVRGDAMSYDEWLAENDPDLYSWYSGYNPYTYAPKNEVGEYTTGGSAFRQLFGLKSTDQKYEFIERFGGLNKTQLESKLSTFVDKINNAFDNSDMTASMTDIKSAVGELKTLMRNMGIEEDVIAEFDKFDSDIDKYIAGVKNNGEMTGDFFKYIGLGVGGGGVAGATVGTIVPGAGTLIGGAIGALAGLIGGIAGGAYEVSKSKKQNKANKQKSKDIALNLVYNLMAYAEDKRQQAQR